MQPDIKHSRTRYDSDIKLLLAAVKNARSPHERQVSHLFNAFLNPLENIVLNCMASENNERFFSVQQHPVHRIKRIRYQIIIKRIVKENTLSVKQIQCGIKIVVINSESAPIERGNIRSKCNDLLILALFKLADNFICCRCAEKSVIDTGVFRKEFVAENRTQKLTQKRVVDGAIRLLVFSENIAGKFLFCQSVKIKIQFAYDKDDIDRIKHCRHKSRIIKLCTNNHKHRRDRCRRPIKEAEKLSEIKAVFF